MTTQNGNRRPDWPGDPAALEADGVDFEALGHVLGNLCWRGGRTRRFYSVAQQALTVCDAVQQLGGLDDEHRRTIALHALLGDAWRAWLTEPAAYTSAKSVERHVRDRAAVQRTVLEAVGAAPELPESWAQALELTRRMAESALLRDLADAGVAADGAQGGPLFPPLKERTRPLRPDRAAKRWIAALEELRPQDPQPDGLRPEGQRPEGQRPTGSDPTGSRPPGLRLGADAPAGDT